jgi:septal ring factor EnvC (AmiA/AmiB activator)
MDLSKFEILEGKIAAILEKKLAAEKRTADLEASLKKADEELATAQAAVKSLEAEKAAVVERLDAILERLDG